METYRKRVDGPSKGYWTNDPKRPPSKSGYTDIVWPKSYGYCCHHCCHPFTTAPIPEPVKYDDRLKAFTCSTHRFCSWACSKAYILSKHTCDAGMQCEILSLLYKRTYGVLGVGIRPAPSRFELKMFGGKLTIEQFRAMGCQTKNTHIKEKLVSKQSVQITADTPTYDNIFYQKSYAGEITPEQPENLTAKRIQKAPEKPASLDTSHVKKRNESLKVTRPVGCGGKTSKSTPNILDKLMQKG